jgi:hypothetical protein
MSDFDDEMESGFNELAGEAGTGLSFGGVAIAGVLDDGDREPLNVRTKIGSVRRSRLMISRTELTKLPAIPKVGDSFAFAGGRLSIKDVEDFDPTDPTVVFIVKQSPAP